MGEEVTTQVEPAKTQVEPAVPAVVESKVEPKIPAKVEVEPQTAAKSEEIARLERQLAEARKSDRVRHEALKKEREEAGNYKAILDDQTKEYEATKLELQTVKSQLEEVAALKTELSGYKESLLASFNEEDRAVVKDLSISSMVAMYRRLYGSDLVKPSQSPASAKPGTAPGADVSLEAAVQSGKQDDILKAFYAAKDKA